MVKGQDRCLEGSLKSRPKLDTFPSLLHSISPRSSQGEGMRESQTVWGALQCKRKCPFPHPFALSPTAAASSGSTEMFVPAQRPDSVLELCSCLLCPGTPPVACWRKAQPQLGKAARLPMSSRGKGCAVPKAERVPGALFPTQRPQGAPEPLTWGLSLPGRLRCRALLW